MGAVGLGDFMYIDDEGRRRSAWMDRAGELAAYAFAGVSALAFFGVMLKPVVVWILSFF
jgi:hypothetical protein